MNEIDAAIWRCGRNAAGWPSKANLRRRELRASSGYLGCLRRGLQLYFWLKDFDEKRAADIDADSRRAAIIETLRGLRIFDLSDQN